MRVGRMIQGSTKIITDIVKNRDVSVLLLGVPGVGKTTLLREYARLLAENAVVEVVDTSNEIAGDGDVPHSSIGTARRMMVKHRKDQHEVMIEAVQNHMPQYIIVDEIGTVKEVRKALCLSICLYVYMSMYLRVYLRSTTNPTHSNQSINQSTWTRQ